MCGPKGKEEDKKERLKESTINVEIEKEKIHKCNTLCSRQQQTLEFNKASQRESVKMQKRLTVSFSTFPRQLQLRYGHLKENIFQSDKMS